MLKSTFLPGEMTAFHGQISLFFGWLKTHGLAPRNPETWKSWLPNATSGNLGQNPGDGEEPGDWPELARFEI